MKTSNGTFLPLPAARLAALTAACLGLSGTLPSLQAQAVATPETDKDIITLETYTVSGMRANLVKAEQQKREIDQVAEVINAEDIGKFPDRSMGEALQRIPGVQVSRNNGEVTEVLVRGLPDLATTLNGNEVFTGNGRRLSMQDLPVQALAGIQAFKTATSDQLEGGLAGLLNGTLRSPFDFAGNRASAYVDYRHVDPNGTSAKPLNNLSVGGLVSGRKKLSGGRSIGLLLDFVSNKDRYNNPVQWSDLPTHIWAVNETTRTATKIGANPDGTYTAPAGTRLGSFQNSGGVYAFGERNRPMGHAAFAYRVSPDLEFNVQALYTGYTGRVTNAFIFTNQSFGGLTTATDVVLAPEGDYSKTIVGTISPILSATFSPVLPNGVEPFTATSTQALDQETDTFYTSIGMKWKKDRFSWNSDLAFVDSTFREDRVIVDQRLQFATTHLVANDGTGHGGFSATTPTSSAPLKDPREFRLMALFQSYADRAGHQLAWRNDFSYRPEIRWIRSIDFGARLATQNATNHAAELNKDVPIPGPFSREVPVTAFGNDFNLLVPGIDRLGGSFQIPNPDYLLDKADTVRAYYLLPAGRIAEDPNRLFDQDEKTAALYAQLRYGFDLAGLEIKGFAGVRGVRTDRTLRGKNRVNDVVSDFNKDTSDDDVVPAGNLTVKWTPKLQSRFSVGKSIRRPDFAQLNPSIRATPPTESRPGSASAGNPDLKPVESVNYDATLEYYFEKNGFLQASYFYRDIKGYYATFTRSETIEGIFYRDVSRPANSDKGNIEGFEVGGQKFFDFLSGPLGNFGLQANYTYITGENFARTSLDTETFVARGFPGVAKSNYNVAVMYEGHGLTGRLALTHRGDYLEASLTGPIFKFENRVKASDYVDLSLGYQVNKNLTVQFDALNLTREDYESYQGDPIRPRDIRYGSRVFLLGLRWKL